jgi:hypothetical protein
MTATLLAGLIRPRWFGARLRIAFLRAPRATVRTPIGDSGPQCFGDSYRWPDGSWTTSG